MNLIFNPQNRQIQYNLQEIQISYQTIFLSLLNLKSFLLFDKPAINRVTHTIHHMSSAYGIVLACKI